MLIELATAIRKRRLKLGLTEERFSQRLGISVSLLREIERGVLDLDVTLLHAAAEELGWTAGFLMHKTQILVNAKDSEHHRMTRSVETRRQLTALEKQHERMLKQHTTLVRQAQSLPKSWMLAEITAENIESVRLKNLRMLKERLELQKESLVERTKQLARTRKLIDEQDRFAMRRKRLLLVSS